MKLPVQHGKHNICGERVREARTKAKLSQEEVAAKIQLQGLSITQKAISRIETGLRVVPDYEIAFLAAALDVSPLWILGIEEDA